MEERDFPMVKKKSGVKKIKEKNTKEKDGKVKKLFGVDFILLFTTLLLLVIGLTMLFSTTSATDMNSDNVYGSIIRQGGVALIGLVAMFAFALRLDHRYVKPVSVILYVLIMLVMIGVSFFGLDSHGARRQINTPVGSLQPSEFSKYAMIILLSVRFAMAKKGQIKTWKEMWICLAIIGIPSAICLILQRHASGAGVHIIIGFLMLLVAGVDLKKFIPTSLIVGGISLAVVLLTDFRYTRIMSYLNQSADAQGDNYQANQAILAVGSGGLFGLGLGNGRQKYSYLPEAENDYIFAIVGEELGFIGSVIVVLLFCILIWRGITIALNCKDTFGTYMAFGITALLGFQVALNMFVVLRLFPSTGMQLPFFSKGGSSMLATLMGIGLLLSVSRDNIRRQEE